MSGNVVLIDAGGRTVNVALFRDGQYRAGATLELGVQAALDNLDDALRVTRPTDTDAGRARRAGGIADRRHTLHLHLRGPAGARRPVARQQLDATAAALVQELRTKVPIDQARRVVFVGGGAYDALFGATVKALLPRCEASGLRALANAYGALGAVPVREGKEEMRYIKSISKALADAIEERRGVLTIQEVTVAALVVWLEAPTLAERVSA